MRKGHILLALGLSFVLPQEARAEKRPMTFEDILGVKHVSDPKISRDGQTVVFTVTEADLEKNISQQQIWRFDKPTKSLLQMTSSGKRNHAPRWSPKGGHFAFLSDRGKKDQIFLMNPKGGEATPLTEHETDVLDFRWSPDGSRIAFTAVDPKSPEKEKREKAGDDSRVIEAEFDWPKLWVIDVETQKEEPILDEDMNVEEFAWSPDGSRFALVVRPTTLVDRVMNREIYTMSSSGGSMIRLTDNRAAESEIIWTADGKSLFYTATDESRFVNAESKLFRIDVETHQINRMADDYAYGIRALELSPEGKRLYFLSGIKSDQRLCAVEPLSGKIEELSAREGTVLSYDASSGGSSMAFIFSDTKLLPELWTAALEPFRAQPAPKVNPQINTWRLGGTKVVQWKSSDGWDVEGLLTLPVDYQKGRRYPLVVVIHGGPESAYTKAFRPHYLNNAQVYAGRGWAVLRPNYRGGSNYGDEFIQGMNADTGGGDFHDIMTGVDFVIAEGIADPDRLAVTGWSWGGISTGWIVTQTDRFKAASAGAMVSNHFSVFGQADLTYDVEYFYVGGTPYEDPSRYLRMSPIGHVMKAKTPTILLHGMEDVRCPFPQSVEFYKGLKAAGVETKLVGYPREPHVFREPQHMLDKMEREYTWFEMHVLK